MAALADQFEGVERSAARSRPGRAREALDRERARFFLWAPVALGTGIAAYFALPSEPPVWTVLAILAASLGLKFSLPRGTLSNLAASALVLVALGACVSKLRVEYVRAPVLEKSLRFVEITGTVERAETKAPRGQRLTIVTSKVGDLPDGKRPARVRVRTMKSEPLARPGDRVTLKATLSPPAKPALPGGFDFARLAWFDGVGGVGYTLSAPQIEPGNGGSGLAAPLVVAIEKLRGAINARIMRVLPNETGAIATALITGERGGITRPTNDAYKNSGLFHILSISGLHMVVMAGAVFYSVRLLLAAVPYLALNFEIKKWAAVAGILGTLGYLSISGGSFATVRSALMILVMFLAILLERPAIALRNVALAALLILLVYPESLYDAGFQMSFAAVAALIAAYEEIRRRFQRRNEPHPVLKVLMFFGGIITSTIIATIAVAPFAAYHFHQSQQYAMIANLVAIPICNTIVMPAALAALVLMPLGLEATGLYPMGWGIDAMTWCAQKVAALPGSVGHLAAMPDLAFMLMLTGGLWLVLWRAWWRVLGLAPALAGLAIAPFLPRPDVLISRQGELVAVRGADGLLSALPARQAKYEIDRWLEHDGDARTAKEAADARAFRCDATGCIAGVKGATVSVVRHPSAIADDCSRAQILVMNVPRPKACPAPKAIVDVFDVYDLGAHALYVEDGGKIRIDTVAAHRGERPWAKAPEHHLKVPRLAAPRSGGEGQAGGAGSEAAVSGARLPKFAARPDLLIPHLPRPEIEDDGDEFAGHDAGIDAAANGDGG